MNTYVIFSVHESSSDTVITMSTRRRRQKASHSGPKQEDDGGPNVHLSQLKRLLDTQIKREVACDAEHDANNLSTMEASIEKGVNEIKQALDKFLQDPFATDIDTLRLKNSERAALRDVAVVLKNVRQDVYKTTEEGHAILDQANESLVKAFGLTRKSLREPQWQPTKFRIFDRKDPSKLFSISWGYL